METSKMSPIKYLRKRYEMEFIIWLTFVSNFVGTKRITTSRNIVSSFKKKKVINDTEKKPINNSPTVPAIEANKVVNCEKSILSAILSVTMSIKVWLSKDTVSLPKNLIERVNGSSIEFNTAAKSICEKVFSSLINNGMINVKNDINRIQRIIRARNAASPFGILNFLYFTNVIHLTSGLPKNDRITEIRI
jgi:hypothetical protein